MTAVLHQTQAAFEAVAQGVAEGDVHLLDAGGVVGRHHQKGIGEAAHPAAVAAAEARRHGIQGARRLQRPDDVLAVAGGGNPDDHVAGAAQGLDLARFLVGAPIASVLADTGAATGGISDDVTLTLRFADGSLATVAYTALGDMAFGKERIEAYAGGAVFTIDDFRTLVVAEDGRVASRGSRRRQDKGFTGALKAFVDAVAAGGPAPVDEAEVVETSFATIAVLESLRAGGRVDL